MTDPTGTASLRRAFQAEGNRRLGQVRSLTHTMLVEHDLMQARDTPWAQLFPQPGHRLSVFAEWFSRTVDTQLLGMSWWEKYLQRAYDFGLLAGGKLVGPPPGNQQPLPAVYRELATRELAGIAAALVQQVSRQAGGAALTRQKPQLMYRQVLTAIKKVGMARLQDVRQLHDGAAPQRCTARAVQSGGRYAGRHRGGTAGQSEAVEFLKHDHAIHDALSASAETDGTDHREQKNCWQGTAATGRGRGASGKPSCKRRRERVASRDSGAVSGSADHSIGGRKRSWNCGLHKGQATQRKWRRQKPQQRRARKRQQPHGKRFWLPEKKRERPNTQQRERQKPSARNGGRRGRKQRRKKPRLQRWGHKRKRSRPKPRMLCSCCRRGFWQSAQNT